MAKLHQVTHRFVDRVPSPLEDGVLYVSVEFGTVIHKCCCGCGDKVVTPLTPVDWAVIYDGQSISLRPSIGRWDAPCQSHYWIDRNKVIWAGKWSPGQIKAGKAAEARARAAYYGGEPTIADPPLALPALSPTATQSPGTPPRERFWRHWLRRRFGS
jgi:hypothetical protein